MRAVVVAALLGLSGCMEAQLVPCGDKLCPAHTQCVSDDRCASADAVSACDGVAEAEPCLVGGTAGMCDRGVCTATGCGNGEIEALEVCDDGNATSGDGCRGDCRKVEQCGDAITDDGESCDDGNANPADGCDGCTATEWQATAKLGGSTAALGTGLAPTDVTADRYGNVYIAETDRIRRVDTSGVITTIAGAEGGDPFFDGCVATSTAITPRAIEVDGLGNVYVADQYAILRIDPRGIMTTAMAESSTFTIDGFGNIYFSKAYGIHRLELDGTVVKIAGTTSGFSGDGGPATSARFSYIDDLTFDTQGNLYLTDRWANRVRRIDTAGIVTTVAGNGSDTVSGDGGPATSAGLGYFMYDITVDASGVLYVTSSGGIRRVGLDGIITTIPSTGAPRSMVAHHDVVDVVTAPVILRMDAGGTMTRFAGNGQSGDVGDGTGATGAKIGYPEDILIDAQGNLYINGYTRVRRVDAQGVISTVAGTGLSGSTGDGGLAIDAHISASGISLDAAGNLYIADYGGNRIRKVDGNGIITTVVGTGVEGDSGDGGPALAAELDNPGAVLVAPDGVMYIADRGNYRIRKVGLDGIITGFAGNGTPGSGALGDGGPAIDATLSWVKTLALDAQGQLYFSDSAMDRVRRVDTNGIIETIAGNGIEDYTGDGGPGPSASLSDPAELAFDAAGDLYIADSLNYAIRRVDATGTITTHVGGVFGPDGDGGPAATCELEYTYGLDIDSAGNMYIADTDDLRVRRIGSDGLITTVAGNIDPQGVGPLATAQLADPRAFVITPDFTLVAGGSSGTVQAIRPTWLSTVIGRYPQFEPTGSLARYRTEEFGAVSGVAYDAVGRRIFLTEGDQIHVVDVVDSVNTNTWTIATLTGGIAGFADGPVTSAQFRAPTGLDFDPNTRKLYVADSGNHVVRVIDLSGGLASAIVSTFAGTPATRGFHGDGGLASDALLYQPRALAHCANGDIFVADTGNQRVRRIVAGTRTISTVLGDGVAASSGEGAPASAFPLDTPLGIACDVSGNVFATSSTAVRLLPANDSGIVDGTGAVQTIYGAPPRDTFPANVTGCLTGVQVVDATTLQVTDSCTGMLVELRRVAR